MKFLTAAATAVALTISAGAASAACDDGEIVVKFSHVTNGQAPQGDRRVAAGTARERRYERHHVHGGFPELHAV